MMRTWSMLRRRLYEKARRMSEVLEMLGIITCKTRIKFGVKLHRMHTKRYRMYQHLHPDLVYYLNHDRVQLMGGCLHSMEEMCKWCSVEPHEVGKEDLIFLKTRCRILCRIWNEDPYVIGDAE